MDLYNYKRLNIIKVELRMSCKINKFGRIRNKIRIARNNSKINKIKLILSLYNKHKYP